MVSRTVRTAVVALATSVALSGVPIRVAFADQPARIEAARGTRTLGDEMVDFARKYLDTQYNVPGRLTSKYPGLDCLGLLFKVLQDKYGVSWTRWSYNPTTLVPQLSSEPKTYFASDYSRDPNGITNGLKKGDFVFFLWPRRNEEADGKLREPAMARDQSGNQLWVWHTAMYAGDGRIIHATPFDDNYKVVEEKLPAFMDRNGFVGFVAITPDPKFIQRKK